MDSIDFGVCRLSVIAVRAEPSDKAEQVTQLLFGDHYEVIEQSKDKKWIYIRINFDQYQGWLDIRQHHPVSKEYFEYFNRAEFKITIDLTSSMLYNKSPLIILMGSMIPISSSELFKMEEQFAFNGDAKNVGQKREFEYLKNIALKYVHAPYQWGGKTPFGIDCSALTQMVYKICGYKLQRDSFQQATQGKPVKSFHDHKPGDLAFFKNKEDKINHVGIILDNDRIIHASGRVRIDHISDEGILNVDTKIYTHSFSHIRRFLPE